MKITDQNGLDITAELAPDAVQSQSEANPAVAAVTTSQTIAPSDATDPTHAMLTAYHAAQHPAHVSEVAAHHIEAPSPVQEDYEATPGEVALHAGLSMIAQHVEGALNCIADLQKRVTALEADNADS